MRPRAILGVLLLGALVLRLLAIGDRLSHDEGYTWLVASAHAPGAFLHRLQAYENTPPLYYLLTWPLPNAGVAWLRLTSVAAGVGCVAATWWVARTQLTTHTVANYVRAPIFAAAALAVAPFAVSYSDYARGFVLADAALLVALGAALRKRWILYAIAAAIALYTEYDSALFLLAIAIALREWRAALPVALLIPWLPFIKDSDTKVAPIYPNPSPASLRDTVVRLTFGEHGTAHATSARDLQLLLVAAVCVWAFRKAPRMIGATAALTLVLHATTHWIGPDVFAPRYLTELIPLGAIALGYALADTRRELQIAAAVALLAVGAAVAVRRSEGNDEPDLAKIERQIAPLARQRTVLTNSAAFAYYLRELHPHLDRPFGLGRGMEASCHSPCRRSFLIVDDLRVAAGPRLGPGKAAAVGPVYIRATSQVGRAGTR